MASIPVRHLRHHKVRVLQRRRVLRASQSSVLHPGSSRPPSRVSNLRHAWPTDLSCCHAWHRHRVTDCSFHGLLLRNLDNKANRRLVRISQTSNEVVYEKVNRPDGHTDFLGRESDRVHLPLPAFSFPATLARSRKKVINTDP